MRGWLRIVTVLTCVTLVAAVGSIVVFRHTNRWTSPVVMAHSNRPVTAGSVTTLRLPAADAPDGSRPVWMYRPGVPDSSDLPVLYLLHGLPGSIALADDLYLRQTLDTAFTSGKLRPFVVVVPDGNSVGAYDTEWADSVAGTTGSVRLESFVTGPLIKAVEGHHRRDRTHRAIAGFSMGGYGAMNLALRHAKLYSQVVSLAGYFHIDDQSGVFGGLPAAQQANSPDQHVANAARTRVMLADGDADGTVAGGETARMAALMRNAGQHPVVSLTTGGHTDDWLRSTLPATWTFLEQGWPIS